MRCRLESGLSWPRGVPGAAAKASPALPRVPQVCGRGLGVPGRLRGGRRGRCVGRAGPHAPGAPALSLPLTICHSIRAGRQLRGWGERGWGSATPRTTACCLADEKKFKC